MFIETHGHGGTRAGAQKFSDLMVAFHPVDLCWVICTRQRRMRYCTAISCSFFVCFAFKTFPARLPMRSSHHVFVSSCCRWLFLLVSECLLA